MAYYKNPYFNHNYVPETYDFQELQKIVSLSGWDILKNVTEETIPYLCQLLKVADIADVDPIVAIQSAENFDIEKHMSTFYQQLTSVDEGRVNLYEVWSEANKSIVPRALTQIEIAQAGGCQIIDGYICGTDGVKIKEKTSVCDEKADYRKPITYNEIKDFVTTYMDQKKDSHADDFVNHLKVNYIDKGWQVKLIYIPKFYHFIIRALKDRKAQFFRYYLDRRDYVSEKLNIPLTVEDGYNINLQTDEYLENNFTEMIMTPIPKKY